MRTKLNITGGIFPMPVLMVATYNEDGSVSLYAQVIASYLLILQEPLQIASHPVSTPCRK